MKFSTDDIYKNSVIKKKLVNKTRYIPKYPGVFECFILEKNANIRCQDCELVAFWHETTVHAL